MCGMYIINGVHGSEPRSIAGNTSSNPHVSIYKQTDSRLLLWNEGVQSRASLLVGLLVSLLATLLENLLTDFYEFFSMCQPRYKEQAGKFRVCYVKPLENRVSFLCNKENPCQLATLRENGWMDSQVIFTKVRAWGKEQSGTFSGCLG